MATTDQSIAGDLTVGQVFTVHYGVRSLIRTEVTRTRAFRANGEAYVTIHYRWPGAGAGSITLPATHPVDVR